MTGQGYTEENSFRKADGTKGEQDTLKRCGSGSDGEDVCRDEKVATTHRPDSQLLQTSKAPMQETWELRNVPLCFVFTDVSTEW